MKVITMESSAFTALTEQIAEIAAHVRAVSGGRKEEAPDRLLTTREAAHLYLTFEKGTTRDGDAKIIIFVESSFPEFLSCGMICLSC